MRLNKETNFPNGFKNGVSIEGVPLELTYTNNVFWVSSSGGSNGNPGTKQRPFSTIDYAVGKCTANKGDLILVKPGHVETISASTGIDVDVAGVNIVGLGEGTLQPQIIMGTSTGADVKVGADNVVLKNLKFECNVASQTRLVLVEDGTDNITFEDCYFYNTTDNALTQLQVGSTAAADNLAVKNCVFESLTAASSDAIHFTSAAGCARPVIENSYFYGDWGLAAIDTTSVLTNALIRNNVIQNDSTDYCILFTGAATGVLNNNQYIATSSSVSVDPGSMKSTLCYSNVAVDANGFLDPATS